MQGYAKLKNYVYIYFYLFLKCLISFLLHLHFYSHICDYEDLVNNHREYLIRTCGSDFQKKKNNNKTQHWIKCSL